MKNILQEYLFILTEQLTGDIPKKSEVDQEKIQKIKAFYKEKRDDLNKNKDSYIQKLQDTIVDKFEQLRDKSSEDIMAEVSKKKSKAFRYFTNKHLELNKQELIALKKAIKRGKIISGLSLATIIIAKSISIYQETEDNYQKFCKNKTGIEKERCIAKVRLKTLQERSSFLKIMTTRCKKSQDPVECKNMIDKEVVKIENQIQKYMNEFGHSMID